MENLENRKPHHEFRIRFLFGCLLAAVTLLLVGASRLGDSMATRQTVMDQARTEWINAAKQLLMPLPRQTGRAEHELQQLAAQQPELFLQVFHQELQRMPEP